MAEHKVIGIDLGATNVRGAVVDGPNLGNILSSRIHSDGSVEEVLQDIYGIVDQLMDKDISSIGIGVPSVVDIAKGIVYDVTYIPSWKEVHLRKLMEARYGVPVHVNNDANCFALGELYFGKGRETESFIGLTLGTGLGAGIIIHRKLYPGSNCGAGEFGMAEYLDHCYEYYASGQFFQNVHHIDGEKVYKMAVEGDAYARSLYAEMGMHLGKAMRLIMYTYDPSLVIMGGSVRHAYPYFSEAMWAEIDKFAFTQSQEKIRIEISELENSGILGAAGLHYDAGRK